MGPPTPIIYHQNKFPLPLKGRNLVIAALFKNPQIEELDAQLLEKAESCGWVTAMRERTVQLMRTQPELSCKEIKNMVIAEAWEEGAKAPVVDKQRPLDVPSSGTLDLPFFATFNVPSSGRCWAAGQFPPSLMARLLEEDIKGQMQRLMGVTSLSEIR